MVDRQVGFSKRSSLDDREELLLERSVIPVSASTQPLEHLFGYVLDG